MVDEFGSPSTCIAKGIYQYEINKRLQKKQRDSTTLQKQKKLGNNLWNAYVTLWYCRVNSLQKVSFPADYSNTTMIKKFKQKYKHIHIILIKPRTSEEETFGYRPKWHNKYE